MANIYKVENPVYLDYDEMWEHYEENMVVITEAVWREHPLHFVGGVVRYYGDDKKGLMHLWADLNHSAEYGKCYFEILIKDKGGIHIHD
jgi:hypothetical protein